MNKLYRYLTVILLGLAVNLPLYSQSGKLTKADKSFDNYEYQKAIDLYADIASNGYKEASVAYVNSRLGDSYRLINDTRNAEKWYTAAVEAPNCDSSVYFQYAQVLRSNKKYLESAVWMKKYLKVAQRDKESVKRLASFRNYSGLMADSNQINIEFMNINSNMSDYSPSFHNNKIIFVSSRDTISIRRSSWNDEPFYSLYESEIENGNQLNHQKKVFGNVNTMYHEGPVSYDKNSNVLYFTRSNYIHGKRGESKEKYNYLKIYKAVEKNGSWGDVTELSFNSNEYTCAHPAISPDGKKLYFVSNMPGGFGGTDIYYCTLTDAGWSKPINAGKPINTLGNELFPSFSDNGVLFFASNGHPGLGGLDIYMFINNTVTNLGYPINCSFDDFGLCTLNGSMGFFSSNRKTGLNNDDIYSFTINLPPVALDDTAHIEIKNSNYSINPAEINVLANDFDLNDDLVLSRMKIIGKSNKNSIVKINPEGHITYKPANGFKGNETITYVIYDQNNMSDTANVLVSVVGKSSPVANPDSVLVDKNSEGKEIMVLANDFDPDGNMIQDSIEITKGPKNGKIELSSGIIKYTPDNEFTGKDYLVYQIHDSDGLKDADSVIINVQVLMLGKVITRDLELDLSINFETSKWDIKKSATLKLDSVVKTMQENPNIEIELNAYTDCKGASESNMILSQKRAKSAVEYLIRKGIKSNRIKTFAYGENYPLNECLDGVPCSDEELAINRRVTIKILKY